MTSIEYLLIAGAVLLVILIGTAIAQEFDDPEDEE